MKISKTQIAYFTGLKSSDLTTIGYVAKDKTGTVELLVRLVDSENGDKKTVYHMVAAEADDGRIQVQTVADTGAIASFFKAAQDKASSFDMGKARSRPTEESKAAAAEAKAEAAEARKAASAAKKEAAAKKKAADKEAADKKAAAAAKEKPDPKVAAADKKTAAAATKKTAAAAKKTAATTEETDPLS